MKRKQFFILIILLVIGFASVSTTLILKGNVGVGVELDDFDVIFIEALLDGKEDSKAIISEDKKTITFSTDRLRELNDSARLDYKVKNTSTQYDADVTINCTNEANEYVTVTSSFDGNTIPLENPVNIQAQEVKNGYINAELTKMYAGEDTSIEIKCSIVFTATSREDYAYSLNFDSNGGSKIDDKSITLNDNYGELSTPERIGYTFLGWYDANDNKVDEDTILDSKGNRILYAKWEEKVYPVNIITKANGMSESNTLNVAYGKDSSIKITPSSNYYISSIECSDEYTVEEYNPKVPKYGEQTIKIKNNKVDKEGTCTFTFAQGIYQYGYIGSEQSFTVPLNGEYKVELWGAQGGYGIYGGTKEREYIGGKGAYTLGKINLKKDEVFYLNVGGSGSSGGYNGGLYAIGRGGGATDIRLVSGIWNNFESLKSRIMIAAGGGAAFDRREGYGGGNGGPGGALNGFNGDSQNHTNGYGYGIGTGGTQASAGLMYWVHLGLSPRATGYYNDVQGSFGSGGPGSSSQASGGSGYYGGGGSSHGGGGGGSSFISGHAGCNAVAESSTSSKIVHTGQPNHYSGYVFTNTSMIAGNASMPTHDGKSTMTGNTGNGYAKITLVSID